MDIEQRAHEFALEILKMYFEVNRQNYENTNETEKYIPTDILFGVYNAAYDYVIESKI